ncbi:hypothetical protein EV426DRAFT_709352 [Tirmania nivea]|nr:hypothetical protein EV426DRAFT_709352 [Tirmania nivea]
MPASVPFASDNDESNAAPVAPTPLPGVANAQQQVYCDRMTEFMSANEVWSGGFADCSKRYTLRSARVQGCSSKKIYGIPTSVADSETSHVLDELEGVADDAKQNYREMHLKDILTKFKQRYPITDEDLRDFTRHPSSPQPLILAGRKDKKILVFRIPIPMAFLTTLKETKYLLPTHAEASDRREDGEGAKEWLSAQALLFKHLSEVLKLMDFESYEQMTTHPWLDKLLINQAKSLGQKVVASARSNTLDVPLHKVEGIWYGLAVNCDQEFAGVPHRDGNNVKNSMNCVIPWGSWEGADLLF